MSTARRVTFDQTRNGFKSLAVVGACLLTFAFSSAWSLLEEEKSDIKWPKGMEPLTDRLAGLRNKLQAKNDKSYDEFLSPLRWPFPSGELLKYTLEKCDPNTEIVKIDSLKLDPDPIPTKGEMTVYIDFTVDEDVNPPIKLDLEVSRREYGTWIAISCTGHVGSCTYDNVCPMLQNLCPADVAGELPCKCPLKKGNYKFSKKVSMKLKDYIAGSYQVVVKASNNEKNLACYKATFSIKRT